MQINVETLFQILVFVVSRGLATTITLTVASFFLGLGLGSVMAFLQIVVGGIVERVVDFVTRFLRSIPPILMLFIVFYGLNINNILASIIGLGIISAAYQSQFLRGIAEAVSARQLEAALSVGLSRWEAFTSVVVPQTLMMSTPALLNEFAVLLKDSSIAYAIGVKEMFTVAVNLANARMEYVHPLIAVAVVYLAICFLISLLATLVSEKLKHMGYGVSS